ncbi:predicted protein [Chaetoceros tenuissimus]|uniref:Uncharacterized protein n=1 Tax=Chaetoceros tenuissimus TaxID=426638 RepID=A0AAD3CZS0_9STRA|nr:predicted protein [Chaetoceros tenuissimus]
MKFTILRLIAGSPASRSPLAASSEDEKSSSPESPPAQGLFARYLPSVFSFRRSSDSDVDCADSTSASGSTEGTDGCTNTGGNATAERRASSRASKRPSSSRSVRFMPNHETRERPFRRLADQYWYLHEGCPRDCDLPKKSAEMSPPSCGLMKATSSSCREPLGSGYVIVEGRIRRYSHRLHQKALKSI